MKFSEIIASGVMMIVIAVVVVNAMKYLTSYNLSTLDWKCTQSIVVSSGLPHKEECIQYSKELTEKEKNHE